MNFFLNKNVNNIENMCFNARHLVRWGVGGVQCISMAGKKKKSARYCFDAIIRKGK